MDLRPCPETSSPDFFLDNGIHKKKSKNLFVDSIHTFPGNYLIELLQMSLIPPINSLGINWQNHCSSWETISILNSSWIAKEWKWFYSEITWELLDITKELWQNQWFYVFRIWILKPQESLFLGSQTTRMWIPVSSKHTRIHTSWAPGPGPIRGPRCVHNTSHVFWK